MGVICAVLEMSFVLGAAQDSRAGHGGIGLGYLGDAVIQHRAVFRYLVAGYFASNSFWSCCSLLLDIGGFGTRFTLLSDFLISIC